MKPVCLTLLTLPLLLLVAHAQTPQPLPSSPRCEHFRLPPKLCSSCPLKPFDARGNFPIQKEIHDLDVPACRRQLRRYAQLNPCDTTRAAQIADLDNPAFKSEIGVFMYSICEQCCDCVPIGSAEGEFGRRKRRGELIRVERGNCPAHLVFDVCRVWFWVKSVSGPQGAPRDLERPCPLVREWLNGPNSTDWLVRNTVDMHPVISNFLDDFSKAAGCSRRAVWAPCVSLERAQRRV